jgi:uncharacterized membrane protein
MAQAATRRMSTVRAQHAEHPAEPQPASKPGEPSSASAPRRRSSRGSGTSQSGSGGSQPRGGQREGKSEEGTSRHVSLPGGREIPLPGGNKALSLPGGKEISLPSLHLSIWTRLALKIAKRLAKQELRKLAKTTGGTLGSSALEALEKPQEALKKPREVLQKPREAPEKSHEFDLSVLKPSLPIQQSVDIAVPIGFAWQKWMELSFLPEGVDTAVDIERSGDTLSGRLAGDPDSSWGAEILDERECESFAWRSNEGSDCAGLVTFHQLSDRLTRLELTLDVVPQTPAESISLLTHLADWRARKEMRKFKADLEVVSPDVYADGGKAPAQ